MVAPFAAAMQFGGLGEMAACYRDACAAHGNAPGRMVCSYFTHFADTPEQDMAARVRQMRYFQECVLDALPSDRKTTSPTYHYFVDMVENLRVMKPEHLTDKSVLLGTPQQIIDTVAKADEAGFSEIILYFNVGLKPHSQVLDEMQRFMEDVAPAFDGAHKRIAAG